MDFPLTSANSIYGSPAPEKSPGVSEVQAVFPGALDTNPLATVTFNSTTRTSMTVSTSDVGLCSVLIFSFS
jgi:hypothetical protein